MRKAQLLADRFWPKVDREAPNGCWQWIGATTSQGYGRIHVNGYRSVQQAHRVACWLEGVMIPDGMVVDHKCRNRGCVNPAHMRFVPQRVNARENSASPFGKNADKSHCVHGHSLTDPANIAMKVAYGPKGNKVLCRVCLTCYPSNWRYAVLPQSPRAPKRGRWRELTWLGPQTLADDPRKRKREHSHHEGHQP